nr:HAD hydrolase family protein [Lactobacillus taiwanensis]
MATGRSPVQLPNLEIYFDGYLTFNGSYCFNDKETIFYQALSTTDVEMIIKNAKKLGILLQ